MHFVVQQTVFLTVLQYSEPRMGVGKLECAVPHLSLSTWTNVHDVSFRFSCVSQQRAFFPKSAGQAACRRRNFRQHQRTSTLMASGYDAVPVADVDTIITHQ